MQLDLLQLPSLKVDLHAVVVVAQCHRIAHTWI